MRTSPKVIAAYILITVAVVLPTFFNLLSPSQLEALPGWVSKARITLGLDLRGGSHLVLEVNSKAFVEERMQILADDMRERLREGRVTRVRPQVADGALNVTTTDAAQQADVLRIARELIAATDAGSGKAASMTVETVSPTHIRLKLTEAGLRDRIGSAVEQSLEIVRNRIDEVGVAEPTIQRLGLERILVQLPGVQDPDRIKRLLGSTAKLSFHLVEGEGLAQPANRDVSENLPSRDGKEHYTINRRPVVTGDQLVDAKAGFDQRTNEPIISFQFDSKGKLAFAKFTQANVGKPLAIVLDGKVLSAPVIREPIVGGSGQISGRYTTQETTDLATLLRAGALPAPLTVIEERTVGADLGADAIAKGTWTGLVGFLLVFGFMICLYGTWGLIANLALLLNVLMTLGTLSLLGATLTLPGIAGIVLGIGLAVDANVLINERIREETRKGSSALASLDAGFKRAFSTIVDSNVTTLIASLLLFMFATGPVRGFAVTMGIGIGISMFTAVAVVRILMEWVVRRQRLKTLRIEPLFHLIPDGTSIPFMKARRLGLMVSVVLSVASVILFFKPGLNYGVDFRGGIQVEVLTAGPADLASLRAKLDTLELGEVGLQEFGRADTVLVRAEEQPGGEIAQTQAVKRIKQAVSDVATGAIFSRVEVVGPKVSSELAETGILAVVLASLAMLAYIWTRFEWPFAVGAIATLVLDVTKTVGFLALTGLDFNLTAIAAILALIGYSVNDKVVVYDRMRENMRLYKQMSLRDLIDRSINETLARSIYTSVTAFLAMLPMAIAGGSAVESFAIPMIFGIIIAASSSVFIAAPILLFLGDWRTQRRARIEAENPTPAAPEGPNYQSMP